MGTYRSLWVEIGCRKCGVVGPFDIQFKTGSDYLETYKAGEIVDDSSLSPEKVFAGCADYYCRPCFEAWRADDLDAQRRVIADMAREGIVEVFTMGKRLSPQEIEACRPSLPSGAIGIGSWLHACDLEVLSDGVPVFPRLRTSDAVGEDFDRRMEDAMRRRGWPHGDECFRFDLEVFVSPD